MDALAQLLAAKTLLRSLVEANSRTRSKEVKQLCEQAQTFLDLNAPGID